MIKIYIYKKNNIGVPIDKTEYGILIERPGTYFSSEHLLLQDFVKRVYGNRPSSDLYAIFNSVSLDLNRDYDRKAPEIASIFERDYQKYLDRSVSDGMHHQIQPSSWTSQEQIRYVAVPAFPYPSVNEEVLREALNLVTDKDIYYLLTS